MIENPFENLFNQDTASLYVEKLVVSLDITDDPVDSLEISALDKNGNTEDFTRTETTNHISVTQTENTLSIVGNSLGSDIITINSTSGISKVITVKVYDPKILDDGSGLLFTYTDQFQWQWDDDGSDASSDGAYYIPLRPTGDKYAEFYPLGSIGRSDYTNPDSNDYGVFVKDRDGDGLLAKPTDYQLLWTDSGSGADDDGSFWKPIAPTGYVAMGLVAQSGYSKPDLDLIRCVREDLTVPGKVGSSIWNDAGSGADSDFGSWKVAEPDNLVSADGKAFFLANTFIGAADHDSQYCDMNLANVFDITLPTWEEYDEFDQEPTLSGYSQHGPFKPRFSKTISIPFTLLKDNNHSVSWKVENSPFYYMQRVEEYTSLDFFDNRQGSEEVIKTISFTVGMSQSLTSMFSTELGIQIEAGGEIGAFGTGGHWSVTLTTTFKWETTRSTEYSTVVTKSTKYTIPKGKFGELLQVTGKFRLYSTNWSLIGEIPLESSGLKILEYPS